MREGPMGLLSKLFGKKNKIESHKHHHQPPEKLYATVELKSPYLLAFDLPAEGVKYKISHFEPGIYKIPLESIIKASDSEQSSGIDVIDVDTGVIYFIDADFEENFRKFETQLFEETGDSYVMTENPEDYSDIVGIKFDCLMAPGIGSVYDFVGDGTYKLDVSKIEKI
jgi:hypothetical protein